MRGRCKPMGSLGYGGLSLLLINPSAVQRAGLSTA